MAGYWMTGKQRRLKRILSAREPVVIAAIDDALISGPAAVGRPKGKLAAIAQAGVDALLVHRGALRWNLDDFPNLPVIVNVTASLTGHQHVHKVQVQSVASAVQGGADAIACHVNIHNEHEPAMLGMLGRISEDCEKLGVPLLAIVYPRTSTAGVDDNFEQEREESPDRYLERLFHCVQVGKDLGADFVKTHMVYDVEHLRSLTAEFAPFPIVFSGGPRTELETLKRRCQIIAAAGGAGVSMGRNIFGRDDPGLAVDAIRAGLRMNVHELG